MAANAEIQNGDRLVTSGIDGTYPPGLPVATVVRIERDAELSFARVVCKPAAGVDSGRFVLVLSNEAKAVPRPDETQPGKGRADKPRRSRSRETGREPKDKEQAKDGDGTR
jgi:rod shape-determining protein MreC